MLKGNWNVKSTNGSQDSSTRSGTKPTPSVRRVTVNVQRTTSHNVSIFSAGSVTEFKAQKLQMQWSIGHAKRVPLFACLSICCVLLINSDPQHPESASYEQQFIRPSCVGSWSVRNWQPERRERPRFFPKHLVRAVVHNHHPRFAFACIIIVNVHAFKCKSILVVVGTGWIILSWWLLLNNNKYCTNRHKQHPALYHK